MAAAAVIEAKRDGLLSLFDEVGAPADRQQVLRAFDFAEKAHSGQKRLSGEPYIIHSIEVASGIARLLEQRADTVILSVALLHDVVEDTGVRMAQLEKEFGKEVAQLVDGVTKISHLSFTSPEADQAENFRKLILAMATDLRVILVKLCDRLHNMRTLQHLRPERQKQIARETRDIYAPLAHRLGIGAIKWELEDLALKFLDPVAYREIAQKVASKRETREAQIEEFKEIIGKEISRFGIKAEVTGRPKHFYSIYNKSKRTGIAFDELHDLLGVRIITQDKNDCYRVLGVIHGLFTPVADRFDDYIATPKSNMYQSLHTTVYGPQHRMVEVQIRTREMDHIASYGVAAHYSYKEGGEVDDEIAAKLGGIVQTATEGIESVSDPSEVMDVLRRSFYQDEVFVFTPKGDLLKLPRGSTPIDFAYAVHTELGHHIVGGKVNGRLVPLRYQLRNGESVRVITSPSAQPSEDWLAIVQSPKARSKIRQALRARVREDSIALGRELLEKLLRKERRKIPRDRELEDIAQGLGYASTENMLAALGTGDISPQQVMRKLYPEPVPGRLREGLEKIRTLPPFRPGRGIRFESMENLLFRIAQCCSPIPGERVVGVITRGRGISVHREDCPNAFEERVGADRRVRIEWDVEGAPSFLARLVVHGIERQSLLADIANAVSSTKTNIRRADIGAVGSDARGVFIVEVQNVKHLRRVISAIQKVRGVQEVVREPMPTDGGMGTGWVE